eukprot:Platyproteum_vivax@DN12820_c0_g1_i1.p1
MTQPKEERHALEGTNILKESHSVEFYSQPKRDNADPWYHYSLDDIDGKGTGGRVMIHDDIAIDFPVEEIRINGTVGSIYEVWRGYVNILAYNGTRIASTNCFGHQGENDRTIPVDELEYHWYYGKDHSKVLSKESELVKAFDHQKHILRIEYEIYPGEVMTVKHFHLLLKRANYKG